VKYSIIVAKYLLIVFFKIAYKKKKSCFANYIKRYDLILDHLTAMWSWYDLRSIFEQWSRIWSEIKIKVIVPASAFNWLRLWTPTVLNNFIPWTKKLFETFFTKINRRTFFRPQMSETQLGLSPQTKKFVIQILKNKKRAPP
jgi:hypothetical protein